ncbi:prepilin-type N-terminal cleavage/methylation domain-containing protein [Ruminococcaceae bacterium R-25]|nr:prepilin-type N-terminal cleavage/methylation domain-containing protein [Ruminococcaceae bacterium R-25]SUQ10698.1 prepilin-type N-terminal cleavage/methylation domain-containing protein [Oscillospiraceae bacterium]
MKKLGKSSKKGFTLVELIVVIVILAVLAAMLVPALVGYIDRAKKEKDYQTASTVYAAAQAVLTEQYGKNNITKDTNGKYSVTSITKDQFKAEDKTTDAVIELAGVDPNKVSGYTFTVSDTNLVISWGSVTIKNGGAGGEAGVTYYLYKDGTWGVTPTTDGNKPA